jgi:hypothetical protein
MEQLREFTELLKGCRPVKDKNGNIVIQSILNMEIVCLTTDDEYSLDGRFANPLKIVASNGSYGQIKFQNTARKESILPTNMTIMTKQRAQNHGMVKSGYVPAGKTVTFDDAGCVQGSQTGYFSQVSDDELRLMPLTMREMLYDKVGNTGGHSNVYPAINKLGKDTNSNAGNYLNVYFEKYDKELEQFIAHFERPSKFIGTVVLVDGEIVAIDKFPSFTYAEQVWDLLIRDCYGSLAIMSRINNKTNDELFTNTFNSTGGDSVLDRLSAALDKTKELKTKSITDKIEDLLDLTFESELDTTGNPSRTSTTPKSFILKNDGYVGQVITEENYHHLVSIVRKESFDPSALRKATELKRKARSQDRFSM